MTERERGRRKEMRRERRGEREVERERRDTAAKTDPMRILAVVSGQAGLLST